MYNDENAVAVLTRNATSVRCAYTCVYDVKSCDDLRKIEI